MANVFAVSPDGSVVEFDDGTIMVDGVLQDANGNPVAQTTTSPNAAIPQANTGNDSGISSLINSIGQWGSSIASIVTRTPVAVVGGRTVGVAGSTIPATPQMSSLTLVLLVLGGILIFKALK